ncbi:uncharacterized protein LOC6612195 isoform X4 [Drosophila sechellia]|uniref:uncharacterized protein LOC6612195 isoform X4 n=1 Tax=Drosophila sechellia TaxID=7238 RepID=UPI0013DE5BC2|nr:uncharacterized protein LOC6612195 isoform X4 [Drosophila sechellia]
MASEDVQITSVIDANGQSLPLHGNSLGGPLGPPVKQERPDDAEIRELAAKMKEQQKQQAAQQASRQAAMQHSNGGAIAASSAGGNMQPPITNGNGQTNIMNYLSRHQKLPNGTMQVVPALASNGRSNGAVNDSGSDKKSSAGPCDEESIQGHFGWAQFGKVSIPYIYRQSEKYCSVRMIELKLLGKYLNCLHPDIYSSCTCVRSYYITDAEARLFIEINHKHCDGEFGRDIFNQKDLVVRLSDASKFYQFLDICYRKLVSGSKTPSEKCGFIRINKESVVPYTVRNNQQVVPLFYFEGETENLKTKAELLNGWDLAYLKFCCKVQGIRNELFSSENVAVISLTDIKSYFPNGTEFEDYWPSKVVDSNLLIGNRANVNNSVNWTRQPSAPPPKVTTSVSGSSGPSSSSGGNMGQNTSSASSSANTAGGQQVTSKSQQQHAASAAAAAATAHQQHLMKQRAAAAAAAAGANGVANAANSFGAAAVAAFNSQAAAAASMLQQSQGNNRMLSQATVQALASSGWMSGQTNLQLHAQMMAPVFLQLMYNVYQTLGYESYQQKLRSAANACERQSRGKLSGAHEQPDDERQQPAAVFLQQSRDLHVLGEQPQWGWWECPTSARPLGGGSKCQPHSSAKAKAIAISMSPICLIGNASASLRMQKMKRRRRVRVRARERKKLANVNQEIQENKKAYQTNNFPVSIVLANTTNTTKAIEKCNKFRVLLGE